MVNIPYIKSSRTKASLVYRSKVHLIHRETESVAVAELKVWKVPKNKGFPEGIKYSLFLVSKESGVILIGMDNHNPKGPHIHYRDTEGPYLFLGMDDLVENFWNRVKQKGFLI